MEIDNEDEFLMMMSVCAQHGEVDCLFLEEPRTIQFPTDNIPQLLPIETTQPTPAAVSKPLPNPVTPVAVSKRKSAPVKDRSSTKKV